MVLPYEGVGVGVTHHAMVLSFLLVFSLVNRGLHKYIYWKFEVAVMVGYGIVIQNSQKMETWMFYKVYRYLLVGYNG